MKLSFFFCIALVLAGCHTGALDEDCNPDGSCSNPALVCETMVVGFTCRLKKDKPIANSRCSYESECFCMTCADKCGEAGVKTCTYSDTSVWGSKPAVCECR